MVVQSKCEVLETDTQQKRFILINNYAALNSSRIKVNNHLDFYHFFVCCLLFVYQEEHIILLTNGVLYRSVLHYSHITKLYSESIKFAIRVSAR